ncbi:MAG TPA: hypothetical protein GX528_02155 [Firmicutes bacterium]|nr:hypothetical protein [Bacillota bacterium]
MIKAEVSLYPVAPEEMSGIKGLSTHFLSEHGLDYDSYYAGTSLNTTIMGSPDHVWSALRQLFQENQENGCDVVMVTTLTDLE